MDAPKIVSQLEVVSRLENDINIAFETIEEHLKNLGHSEAKRLFLAATKYPKEDYDYSGESESFIRAYSASKNVKDALVGMGVEVVITKLIEQQQAAQGLGSTETDVPVVEDKFEQLNESLDALITETGWDDKQLPKAAPKKRKTKKAE